LQAEYRLDRSPELAKRGLTPKALKPLSGALSAFRTVQPAVRITIGERLLSGAALGDLLVLLMQAFIVVKHAHLTQLVFFLLHGADGTYCYLMQLYFLLRQGIQ
jgi:hypothetical protein